MPHTLFAVLVALLLWVPPAPAWSQTPDELKRRIEQLERENASLRKENTALRSRVIALEGGSGRMSVAKDDANNTPAAAKKSAASPAGPKWSPWLEFGGNYSSERSRMESALFSPLWQSASTLVFADIRGKLFEENVSEGNFAVGMRHMLPSGWNLGAWVGYDVRRSTTGNVFHQAAFGIEALHEMWDFRLNGYVPLTDAKASPGTASVFLSGDQILMSGGAEVPLYGVDGEVGARVFGDDKGSELRLYAGGFWFDHKDVLREVAGPKARAEWRINDVLPTLPGSRLTFEAGIRNDSVRGTDWEVGAKLRIPFGGGADQTIRTASLTAQERRMTEAIQRDTDIVAARSGAESVSDALTGVWFDKVAYVNGDDLITDVSQAAGDNSLIVMRGGLVGGAQTLQGNQTLLGGGATIQVRGRNTGTIQSFTAFGAMPTIGFAGNDPLLTLTGSNTHVAGFRFGGSGGNSTPNHGIAGGSSLRNLFLSGLLINDVGGNGIHFGDFNQVTIADTKIFDSTTGIVFGNDNQVAIHRTTVGSGVFGSGAFFDSRNSLLVADSAFAAGQGASFVLHGDENTLAMDRTYLSTPHGVLEIRQNTNTLSGANNVTAPRVVLSPPFCDSPVQLNGSSVHFLDDGTGAPNNCPN